MKDAKGHGSDSKGLHSSGVDAIGVTRYHTTKRAYWQKAQKTGVLNPNSYTTKKIWTSTYPDDHYAKQFGIPYNGHAPDDVELAITLPAKAYLPTPGEEGGGSADRITKEKIPISNIREVPSALPGREEWARKNNRPDLLDRVSKGGWH